MTEYEFKMLKQELSETARDHKDYLFTRKNLDETGGTLIAIAAVSLLAYFATFL